MGNEGVWAMVRGKKWKFSRRCSSLWFFTALQTSVSSTLTSHALQSRLGRQMVASILQPPFINFSVVFSDTREVHVNPGCINFLNKKDPWFKQLHGTLDVSSIDYIQRDWAWRWKVQVFSSRKMNKKFGVLRLDTAKLLQNAALNVLLWWWCGTSSTQVISTEVNG